MSDRDNWVIVGRFGRPHGIKGLITIRSFTEPRDNLLKYTDWHALIHHQWQPIKLLHAEMQNKFFVAQIEGYSERELVAHLTNVEIAICSAQLSTLKEGEYYWHQLIGMKVSNIEGCSFGNVVEIIPTGSNDVLVVAGEKRHLIPYLPGQFILEINLSQQAIIVDWDMDF